MVNLNKYALQGQEAEVREIVEKGVTQREKDYALINACRNNHTKVVKYLLEKGAGVNCQDSNEQTPLNHAAYYSRVETVELLMDHGADKSHRNKWNHIIGDVFDPKVKPAMQKKVKAALNGFRTGRTDPMPITQNKKEKKDECCAVCSIM
mmetsp:Transcript_11000/g.17205  ORF Transcript_11000/g.17205 Transcript_11000/m.17205 type:complete len:150 (+) Transcript_11000:45-494(+)